MNPNSTSGPDSLNPGDTTIFETDKNSSTSTNNLHADAPLIYNENLNHFGITAETLTGIVTNYIEKNANREVETLNSLGGIEALSTSLSTHPIKGLTSTNLQKDKRISQYGENRLPKRRLSSFYKLMYDALKDLIMIVLAICGGISIVVGVTFGEDPSIDWIEGFAIWVAIIIVILITAANDMVKERQFEKLASLMDQKRCTAIRDGQKIDMSVFDIMVGDILNIEVGDEIPADCIVIKSNNLKADESSLTGEPDHMKKESIENSFREYEKALKSLKDNKTVTFRESLKISSPILLSGSVIANGSGTVLVIAVGSNTVAGSAFQKMFLAAEPTPLQNKLNALAHDIAKFGLGSSFLALILLAGQFWIIYLLTISEERPTTEHILQEHLEFVLIAITVIVVAVPEGLPLAVTLSLAYSISRMLKDQNFVRRLNSCEIMGGADQICSDKTGTLTQNKMSVDNYWNGSTLESYGEILEISVPNLGEFTKPFQDGMAINNTAYLQTEEVLLPGSNKKSLIKTGVGSSTECAMLFYLDRMGYNYQSTRDFVQSNQLITDQQIFTSERKMMSTTIKIEENGKVKYRTFVKGAAEKILNFCNYRIDSKHQVKKLEHSDKQKIERLVIQNLANQALRCVCLAYKDFDPVEEPNWNEYDENTGCFNMENNLICLGILGIRDPLRLGVPTAIKQCKHAGIKVRMITGDNIDTAKQIALMCGIYNPESGGIAMLGSDFYNLIGGVVCKKCQTEICDCTLDPKIASQTGKNLRVDVIKNYDSFTSIAPKLEVMARSQPRDKYALVTGLKQMGSVVAVTGDGNNDAPALKKADVGFAMGIAGRDVAKLAADIIILDDNFESIVKAVKWGRGVTENIKRFLTFQLTVNVVAVLFTLMTSLFLRQSPLTALQLLWVNLIMDSFASLALATEHPSDELLDRLPHRRDEYLINKNMFAMILSQAIYQLIVLLFVVFTGDLWIPESEWGYLTDEMRQTYSFSEFSNEAKTLMRSGRRYQVWSSEYDYRDEWFNHIGPSRHMTIVFNTFVFMQVFNLLNARNPKRKFNIFDGILNNRLWLSIFFLIVILQTLIVYFGGIIFSTHFEGITGIQWLICLAFGVGGIMIHWLMRLFPAKILPQAGQKEVDLLNEPLSIALASRGRLSRDNFSRLSAGIFNSSEIRKDYIKRSRTQSLNKRESLLRTSTVNFN